MAKATINASIIVEDIIKIDKLVNDNKFPEFKTRGDVIHAGLNALIKGMEIG